MQDWTHSTQSKSSTRITQPYSIPKDTHAAILKDVFSTQGEMRWSELKLAAKANLSRWMSKEIGLNKVDEWITHWQQYNMISLTGTPGTKAAKYRNNTSQLN